MVSAPVHYRHQALGLLIGVIHGSVLDVLGLAHAGYVFLVAGCSAIIARARNEAIWSRRMGLWGQ